MNQIPRLLKKTYLSQRSLICHRGVFTGKTAKSLLAFTESRLDSPGEQTAIKSKVFHAATEVLQNAGKHCHRADGSSQPSTFIFRRENNRYTILTGNAMLKSGIGSLRNKLTHLNTLNKADLRSTYLHQLQHGRMSEDGGAGLGLIRLARISAGKLEFQFSEIDPAQSYFILKVRVDRR